MRIFIMGAGRMGSWLARALGPDHLVAVYDQDPRKTEGLQSGKRSLQLKDVRQFGPGLVINAVGIHSAMEAFDAVLPYLSKESIISDIASVKGNLAGYYAEAGKRFVSTHPMFGPTLSDFRDLRGQNAVIISESDPKGKDFFRNFYEKLHVNIHVCTFEEHDRGTACSLSLPFALSMAFAACNRKDAVPGTTFKRHLDFAADLLREDDALLTEVLFNPYSLRQIEMISPHLTYLTHIIRSRDYEEMRRFLNRLRENIEENFESRPGIHPGQFGEGD